MFFQSKLLKFGAAVACGGITFALSKDDLRHEVASLNPFKSVFAATTESKYSTWDTNWDKRAHEKPKASRHFILIRHGQYNLNGKTDADKKLTKLGHEQAICTGQRLKALGLDKKITHIVESTMARATETCRLIYKQLDNDSIPLKSSDLLREGAPIEPEPPVIHWAPEPRAFFVDGARIETAFREFIHRADVEQENDSVEVIVCHANVIRYFICRALQFPPEAWLRMSLRHASMTLLTVRPNGRVSVKAVGDSGHLPADKLTFE